MKQDLIAQINQAEQQADSTNANKRVIPPLQNWKPKFCGDMNLKICANGEWWHEGSKMTRQSLVDLFAKVLWCEIDENNNAHYFLKNAYGKIGIQVEDAPLHIVAVNQIQHYNQNFYQVFVLPTAMSFIWINNMKSVLVCLLIMPKFRLICLKTSRTALYFGCDKMASLCCMV